MVVSFLVKFHTGNRYDRHLDLAHVRGWGAIRHLFKTKKEQEEFQDELGKFIQDVINEKLKTL